MCGIFGYVGIDEAAGRFVLEGLKHLEYRGYDSWGIAVSHRGRLVVAKEVGRIGDAAPRLPAGGIALGHTRWATHGGVTSANAHPHLDCTGRLALIHNGIIANDVALRRELTAQGHRFVSETDSEIAAHLIESLLARTPAGADQLVRATIDAFRRLEGLNALAVLDVVTGQIAAAKNGSPLVLGWSDHGALLASDPGALMTHTRRVTYVEDGQAVLVRRDGHRLFDISTGSEMTPRVDEARWTGGDTSLGGHPHSLIKEIHDQPAVLRRLARADPEPVQRLAARIRSAGDVLVTGCGSAFHAGLAAQYLLAHAGVRVTPVAASELPHLAPLAGPRTLLIALSQSGETIDVLEAVRAVRTRGAAVAALVNVAGSSLWRTADDALELGAGTERAVLATKSFTAKLAMLVLIAAELKSEAPRARALIEQAADAIDDLLRERASVAALAAELAPHRNMFVIGRGASYPQALEAALKIKEVSYLHAEGFAAGELKHGVIALIEPGTPVLALAPPDDTFADTMASALEVKARGARVIGLAAAPHDAFATFVRIPDLGPATSLVSAVIPQLLGYELAVRLGHDPDRPRHLAKSVTVK